MPFRGYPVAFRQNGRLVHKRGGDPDPGDNHDQFVMIDLDLGQVAPSQGEVQQAWARATNVSFEDADGDLGSTDPDKPNDGASVDKSQALAVVAAAGPAGAATPQTGDICGMWYKSSFDHFEVYGKNFDQGKMGSSGEGLLGQLRGCGIVSGWKFENRTNDPNGYQWYASGNLPVGTKACVGRAVVSAGGATADGCFGPG